MTIGSASQLSTMLAQMLYGRTTHPAGSSPGIGNLASLPGSSQGGGMMSTVIQALTQIGATGSSGASTLSSALSATSSSSPSQQKAGQALRGFVQDLLAAMQAQGLAPNGTQSTPGAKSHHTHGPGQIQQGLQNLISQLQSSSHTSAAGSPPGSSSLGSLQQSYDKLMGALGAPAGNQASLGSFLNTLATDLTLKPPTGNLVSTQA